MLRVLGVVLCALAIASPARADSATALELATRATKLAQAGDRRGAIDLLEQAYTADAQQDYLLQIADLYEALSAQGDPRDVRLAIAHYQLALISEKNPLERQTIEDHLQELKQQLVQQPMQAPPPAAPEVEGAPPAVPPAAAVPPEAPAAPPPAPPEVKASSGVRIVFAAENAGEKYTVAFDDQVCNAPCALQLQPGWRVVTLSSYGDEHKVSLSVPETQGVVRLPPTRHSFFVAGVALTVVGAVVGATFWAIFGAACGESPSCVTANQAIWPIVGGGMLITGVSFLAYYQARDLGLAIDTGEQAKPALRLSSIGFLPTRNGASAGAGFSF